MEVKLNNFINIQINKYEGGLDTTFDTAVLINDFPISDVTVNGNEDGILETTPDIVGTKKAIVEAFFKYFFNNGGKKIHLINRNLCSTDLEACQKIAQKEIAVMVCATDLTREEAYRTTLKTNFTDLYQKIFISSVNTISNFPETGLDEFRVIKIGAAGIQATVAAYLTNINVDAVDGAKDYCFTREEVKAADLVGNDVVAAIMDNTSPKHANADCELNGDVVNIGGNDVKGFAIINQFMLICLQQNLCESLIEVLKTKIKYDNNGVGKVMSAIDLEMKRYIKNGYISLNKYWLADDLVWDNQVIIKKNQLLSNGYKVTMEGFTGLNIANHTLPKIFVLLADQQMIRKIVIEGIVF